MKKEIFKSIPGYEGLYEISNQGNVKSLSKIVKYQNGGVKYQKERLLTIRYVKGIGSVNLYRGTKSTNYTILELIELTFI